MSENNEVKRRFHKEIDALLEKLSESRRGRLRSAEELRRQITRKLDREIRRLYAKKDLIADMWLKRDELKREKIGVWQSIKENSVMMNVRQAVSAPFIYAMVIPAIILHVFLEVYHQVCFRLYGIPRVNPREYFVFDRRHLPYLNWFDKVNCFYCSYFNCLVIYTKEIAGRTERYWCPIKHANVMKDQHDHYHKFVEYDEGEKLHKQWRELRKFEEHQKSEK